MHISNQSILTSQISNKPTPNLKSLQVQSEKCLLTIQSSFGIKGEKASSLKVLPEAIIKIEALKKIIVKIVSPTVDNPSPYQFDQLPAVVPIINQLKDNLKDIVYYCEDYNKRNFFGRQANQKKINEKMGVQVDAMSNHTQFL